MESSELRRGALGSARSQQSAPRLSRAAAKHGVMTGGTRPETTVRHNDVPPQLHKAAGKPPDTSTRNT